MILILTQSNDVHTEEVIRLLRSRGEDFLRLETASFPQRAEASIAFEANHEGYFWSNDGVRVDLARVCSVWNRRLEPPAVSERPSDDDRRFAAGESAHFLRGLWHLLRDRFWVNNYDSCWVAEHKPYQLSVARSVGLRVPRTLITNDPKAAVEFFDCCEGNVIYKALGRSVRESKDHPGCAIFTSRVQRRDLLARLDQIRIAPCIFQEYVPKRVELRITLIGRKVFAAEIDSQASERSKDDWRRYDFQRTRYRACKLPPELESRLYALMECLGLVFGCVDMIVTPGGGHVFLEINPAGQWYWVERLTGMPMVENFVEMLLQRTPAYTGSSS